MSINIVSVCGNVANEPQLMGKESNALRFAIAVNEYVGDGEERANFFDCVVFGKRAKSLYKIIDKGMQLSIAGSLRSSSYEKDGERRYSVEIVCDEIALPPRNRD